MSDWAILRIPFDEPSEAEVIEIMANIPIDWHDYLKKTANRIKKKGRYVVVNFVYNKDCFYPPEMEEIYRKLEKESKGVDKR